MKKAIFVSVIIAFFISVIMGASLGLLGGFLGSKYWQKDVTVTNNSSSAVTKVIDEESAVIAAVEKAGPAVVSIVISKDVPVFQEIGGGTGFIISEDGYVLTNKHVVSETDAEYAVFLQNGDKYDAQVLAKDPFTDLAVLKIEGSGFATVELGDSDALKPGQTVIAIGYALGEFKNTVSKGVISGLGRDIEAGDIYGAQVERLENIIQTDAAINYGNSGGPLLNIEGQVVGINVAIAEGSENVGFSLSINDVKSVIDSVKTEGRIVRPYLGIRYVIVTEEIQENNQLAVNYGALVISGENVTDLAVMPGSPANKAGIEENDIILDMDGQRIDENNELSTMIRKNQPGDKVILKIMHQGEEREIEIVLEEWKNS